MVKKSLLVSIVLLSLYSLNAQAKSIVEFGDLDLIEIFDSSDAHVPTKDAFTLPAIPVKIKDQKGTRYAFDIGKKIYWIEGVDVETSDRIQIESLCNSTQLATDYKTNHYGIRGAGIGCEK